ncbi:hypothetical protein, partial [Nostoc sp. KVJ20]|uniref:hypothetical protein n=1 Tax=Nostoc sp. KVJ20 TaxID=457944 RepID=UPI001C40825C
LVKGRELEFIVSPDDLAYYESLQPLAKGRELDFRVSPYVLAYYDSLQPLAKGRELDFFFPPFQGGTKGGNSTCVYTVVIKGGNRKNIYHIKVPLFKGDLEGSRYMQLHIKLV